MYDIPVLASCSSLAALHLEAHVTELCAHKRALQKQRGAVHWTKEFLELKLREGVFEIGVKFFELVHSARRQF